MIMRPPPISTEADSKVIVPRRNFLIRALGFTAAGASMVLPVVALQSPEERIAHHFKELEAARRLGTRWGAAYRGGRRSGIFVECDLPHTGEAPKSLPARIAQGLPALRNRQRRRPGTHPKKLDPAVVPGTMART